MWQAKCREMGELQKLFRQFLSSGNSHFRERDMNQIIRQINVKSQWWERLQRRTLSDEQERGGLTWRARSGETALRKWCLSSDLRDEEPWAGREELGRIHCPVWYQALALSHEETAWGESFSLWLRDQCSPRLNSSWESAVNLALVFSAPPGPGWRGPCCFRGVRAVVSAQAFVFSRTP